MFKIALCQLPGSMEHDVIKNKKETWRKAELMVWDASNNGAQIAVLPEMWNCPYTNKKFNAYAETETGPTVKKMQRLAQETGIYLVGGSIPELVVLEDGTRKIYNTCFIFDRYGTIIGKHRKAHLFDVNVDGGISFIESETLSAGDGVTVVDTEFGKIGIAICYDIRFPEMSRKMALMGAKLIVLPAAFNMTTGPAHWELSIRMRALDNQVYFAAAAPARMEEAPYKAYGHSCVSDPWGQIIAKTDEKKSTVYADIDFDRVDSIREQLPLLKHRRPDLYK